MFTQKIVNRINKLILNTGYSLQANSDLPFDVEKDFLDIYNHTKKFTMTSLERMYGMYKATQYIHENNIVGDIVECGVWKGGSTMISAMTLVKKKDISRKIYMYDTYEGMTKPSSKDTTLYDNSSAPHIWENNRKQNMNEWCYSPLEEVKANMHSTKYPKENLIFVKGDILKTVPQYIPKKIALLRLDTDWFESTYHELVHLFPRLVKGGVLLLDDYGHWKGAREAVDKFFSEHKIHVLLNRVDYSGRVGIKS